MSELCEKSTVSVNEFIEQAVADGMLRNLIEGGYSIIGHASTIYKCIANEFYKYRLNVIIRKTENGLLDLLIGENSRYSQNIKETITSNA